jgi:uncharacterized protein
MPGRLSPTSTNRKLTMDFLYSPFEVKASSDNDGTFIGYASTFNNVDSVGDTVAPGAFKKTIADIYSGNVPWPALLSQHDSQTPIGILTSLEENETGLRLQGKIATNTERGANIYALLTMTPRPALDGLSIGYRAKDFSLHTTGPAKRTLKGVELVEVSIVTFPADRFARISGVKFEREPVVDEAQLREWAAEDLAMLFKASQGEPRYG